MDVRRNTITLKQFLKPYENVFLSIRGFFLQNTGKVGKEKVIYRSVNEIFDVDANKIREDYYIIGKDLKNS